MSRFSDGPNVILAHWGMFVGFIDTT